MKKPIVLVALGFLLFMYGIHSRTDNALIDYFWLGMAIVGFTIMAKGVKQLRKKCFIPLPAPK
ncbi:MAG: hypothetical protein ISS45_09795 [Candidatus Omnitrophica bacterium]|nr:hypothetical protein [Candidatus Omnitrophota bacterium]